MTNSAPTASDETGQIREHVQYLEAHFDQLEANVSDFRFQVGEDLDDLSRALDAVGTRLDEQQAHTITQD
jgi:hypothetical protein